ncbi:MAG: transporter substrate-binding domain-containing protein [Pseudomonadota bacterium]
MSPDTVLRTALFFFAFACAPLQAHAEKLLIYGDDAYVPVIYLDHGKPVGILPAIFSRLSKDTGDTYELVLLPWKRALDESARGHGGITNISWNKERDRLYDFSAPIYDDDIQLVVLKGKEFPFLKFQDLKGKIAGGKIGASYGEEVDKAILDGTIKIDRDSSQVSRMKKLLLGRIDVAIIGNGNAGFDLMIASDPDFIANRDKLMVLPQPLVRDPLHLAFAKSMHKQAALDRFNKALQAFRKTIEYRRLISQSSNF